MKRAAIYARYSSHKQREESIEEQIDECKEYAEQNDFQVVKVYTDSAVSGKTEDRDGWQEMMQNAKLKMFDVLLVYTIDRMGRDRYALAVAKKALKDCGVTVIPIKQPMVDGPENILLDSLMEGLAEYYNADLARKVNRGMNDNAQKCLANGSKPTIGYIVDPKTKKYIIDEAGAEVVRFVFKSFLHGVPIKEIVKACEANCFYNSNGKPIDGGVISRMLRNIRYTGVYKWKDVVVPDGMPRIISDNDFRQTQVKLAKKAHTNAHGKAKKEYFLSDKVYCGHCGEPWVGDSGYSATGSFYSYYKCRGAKGKKCKAKPIRQEKLERMVYELLIFELFPDEDAIWNYIDFYIDKKTRDSTEQKQVLRYEKQLKATQTKIDNIMKAVMSGIGIDTAQEYLEPLEEEKSRLQSLIDQIQNSVVELDKDKLYGIIKSWIDISNSLASTSEVDTDQSKSYNRFIGTVLKSPLLQKVIITYDNDGNPSPQIKIGIDINGCSDLKKSEIVETMGTKNNLHTAKTEKFGYKPSEFTKNKEYTLGYPP